MKKITVKDFLVVVIFVVLVVCEIYPLVEDAKKLPPISQLLDAVAPVAFSFVGLLEILNLLGLTIFVPDFMLRKQREERMEEVRACMQDYYDQEQNFLRDYSDEKIGYILTNLNISANQLDEIRMNLVEMRCLPLRNSEDAKQKLIKYISQGEKPLVIRQDHVDSAKLTHGQVNYYINFVDAMFLPGYCEEIGSILAVYITELLKNNTIKAFDKVVIPWDSNFLLGLEVGKRLGCPIVKIRYEKGRIEENKCYDGTFQPQDRVLIVHDVLVSADQILHAMEKIPNTCEIVGVCCLIERKEWKDLEGRKKIQQKTHSLLPLEDTDIQKIIAGTYTAPKPSFFTALKEKFCGTDK